MAITEHGHTASIPDAYLDFKKAKVKFIAGCEIYLNDWEPRRQKFTGSLRAIRAADPELYNRVVRNRHLTVLAKNETGYSNLIKLTTQAYKTGLFGMGRTKYPRIWFDKLCEFRDGLIILSGCLNGPVSHEIRQDAIVDRDGKVVKERTKMERAKEALNYIRKFKAAFGNDYYIELQMPKIAASLGWVADHEVFHWLLQIADTEKIPTVLANDSHYMLRRDHDVQKIMMAISQGCTVDSPDLFHVNSDEQFFKTRAELWATFKNGPYSRGVDDRTFEDMCDNTLSVAEKCEPLKIDTAPKLPQVSDNADDTLRKLVAEKLRERGFDKESRRFQIDGREVTYTEQAEIELERFIDKGFASYFLITMDLVQWGKSQSFCFSPRGSAGGSLVCFLLGIHALNPCLWGLSFDRFLSPSRGGYLLNVTMPS